MEEQSQQPALKKAKVAEDNDELINPQIAWEAYLNRFTQDNFYQQDYDVIAWDEFRQQLIQHLNACVEYYTQQLESVDDCLKMLMASQVHTYRGALFSLEGNHHQAMTYFQKAVGMIPESLPVLTYNLLPHFWLVATYYHTGNYQAVLNHVNQFKLKKVSIESQYSDPMYLHSSRFDPEQHWAQFLHLAHTRYYKSEVCFYYACSLDRLRGNSARLMREVYLNRGNRCLIMHRLDLAILNYQKGLELSSKHYPLLIGQLFAYITRGSDYQHVFDQLIPNLLQSCSQDNRYTLLLSITQLCLKLGKVSLAREYLSQQKDLPYSINEAVGFLNAKIEIVLKDREPSWVVLEPIFIQYFVLLKTTHVELIAKSDAFELFTRNMLQCLQRFHRLDDVASTAKVIKCYLKVYQWLINHLESELSEGDAKHRHFPNRCFDHLYVCTLTSVLKFYAWFPNVESLDPLQILRGDLVDHVRAIADKLRSYHLPVLHNGFVPGVANELNFMALLAEICQVTTGDDLGLAQIIRQEFLSGLIQNAPPNLSVDHDLSPSESPSHQMVNIFERYKQVYLEYIDLLLPKSNSLNQKNITQQYQCFTESKQLAVGEALHDCFQEQKQLMLKHMMMVEGVLSRSGDLTYLQSIMLLFKTMSVIRDQVRELSAQFAGANFDQMVLNFFTNKLTEQCQSFYFRYIHDLNRLLTAMLDHGNVVGIENVFESHSTMDKLSALCCEQNYYNSDHALIMSIKIRNAEKNFRQIKERFFRMTQTKLQQKLKNNQASSKAHCLDIWHGSYRVPFPESMVCNSITSIENLIYSSKNLSAHVLTIVFSIPASDPSESPQMTHLHLPLGFSKQQRVIINGFKETQQLIPNLEQDILQRIMRGHDLVSQHRVQHEKDPCQVMRPGDKPAEFDNITHRHSEQYLYAYLSRLLPRNLVDRLQKLPGGEFFKPGITVHMISLDMASIRTSCRSCRLSAMAIQNHAEEFVARLTQYFGTHGFIVTDALLKTITRVIASKENGMDPVHLTHRSPNIDQANRLDNFSFFEVIRPGAFVSGSVKNALVNGL